MNGKGDFSIQTRIDMLLKFIKVNSPVKESCVPKNLKILKMYEDYIRILESNGMIEVKMPFFSGDRIFVFKTGERMLESNILNIKVIS